MIAFGDGRRAPAFPVAVILLIFANVVVFGFETRASDLPGFVDAFATIPYDLTHGLQLPPPSPPGVYTTLLTAPFLHANLLHLVSNMLFLFVFGRDVEFLCGHVRFVAFYLVCGVLGGLAQTVVAPDSHVPVIGASGAVAGVLGAYVVTYPANSILTVLPLGFVPALRRFPAALVIGIWAVSQFVSGFSQVQASAFGDAGGVAYFGHIGGFVAGVFLIGAFRIRTPERRGFNYHF